jgi:hypothetical protein
LAIGIPCLDRDIAQIRCAIKGKLRAVAASSSKQGQNKLMLLAISKTPVRHLAARRAFISVQKHAYRPEACAWVTRGLKSAKAERSTSFGVNNRVPKATTAASFARFHTFCFLRIVSMGASYGGVNAPCFGAFPNNSKFKVKGLTL